MSDLHKTLVADGNYDGVEILLKQFYDAGKMKEMAQRQRYQPVWERLDVNDRNESVPKMPGPRGGHQVGGNSSPSWLVGHSVSMGGGTGVGVCGKRQSPRAAIVADLEID